VRRRAREGVNGKVLHQRIWIYKGLPVQCKVNTTINVIQLSNGDILTVGDYDAETITMVRGFDEATVSVPMADNFIYSFYPAYCLTIHSAQGQTFDENYTLHEMDRYDPRLLYVALSRCTDLTQIHKGIHTN